MQANQNLPQFNPARNESPSSLQNYLKVKTTVHTKSQRTGLIIPAETIGTVLGVTTKDGFPCYLIDFGLSAVLSIPVNSQLIEFVRVTDEAH